MPLLTSTTMVTSLKTSTTVAQTGLPIQPKEFCYVVPSTHRKCHKSENVTKHYQDTMQQTTLPPTLIYFCSLNFHWGPSNSN